MRRYGRKKPPGLTAEEAARRSNAHWTVPVWRLADRDDENEAAMAAIGGETGWKSLCMTDTGRMHYAKRDFGIAFESHLSRATKARQWGAARQIAAHAPRQLTGPQ
jgi:hypothetical protein